MVQQSILTPACVPSSVSYLFGFKKTKKSKRERKEEGKIDVDERGEEKNEERLNEREEVGYYPFAECILVDGDSTTSMNSDTYPKSKHQLINMKRKKKRNEERE